MTCYMRKSLYLGTFVHERQYILVNRVAWIGLSFPTTITQRRMSLKSVPENVLCMM